MGSLEDTANKVVTRCLAVAEGESVLVLCNLATVGLGRCLYDAAVAARADATLMEMLERPSNGAEPPPQVAAAMAASDVVIAPTVQSVSHTAARKEANEKGARIATLPGVTEEMLIRVMSEDLDQLTKRSCQVADLLTSASEVHITCDRGSDLRFGLDGRGGICDAGDITARGAFGNIPCGEGYIAPLEGTANGTVVIDGSIATFGVLEQPATLQLADGHLIEGDGVGSDLLETLNQHGPDGTNLAEFGVGTNAKAQLTGEILEDEKILGTVHIAFGASAAIGGTVQVPIHLDCVVMKPTVELDGSKLLEGGELLL